MGNRKATRSRLTPDCRVDALRPLEDTLRARVLGQSAPLDSLICSFSRLLSGLHDPSRPLLTALLIGPTGVGKTETAKAVAHTLFGSERALTRVNCEEYAHGHEISKLLGSPPGYVGNTIEPLLSQGRIDAPHKQLALRRAENPGDADTGLVDRVFHLGSDCVSVILFDEIEKAHPIVWNALLGILEDGMLTLGDNSTTDFTRSIILMTSNVGSRQMGEALEHRPLGFEAQAVSAAPPATDVAELAVAAAQRVFPYEFLNRFDEILIYSPLEREHLELILDKFLADLHGRALNQAGIPLLLQVSLEAKAWIVDMGYDPRFGARPLRRAIERYVVDPLSQFIASSDLAAGDIVELELDGDALAFYRRERSRKEQIA